MSKGLEVNKALGGLNMNNPRQSNAGGMRSGHCVLWIIRNKHKSKV